MSRPSAQHVAGGAPRIAEAAAAASVVTESSHRGTARSVADSMAAHPPVADAEALLERPRTASRRGATSHKETCGIDGPNHLTIYNHLVVCFGYGR